MTTTKRGRKSQAALEAGAFPSASPAVEPPYSLLSDEAAEIWRATISSLPHDWIPGEALPVLEAYCAHVATARLLEREISRFKFAWFAKEGGPERLDLLTKMRDREHRAMLAAARSLRLTPQSRMRAENAATKRNNDIPAGMAAPWEFER